MILRAVVDTNVVVSGLLSPDGRPARALREAGLSYRLVWSPGIVDECIRVLQYPRISKVLRKLGREAMALDVVRALASGADMISAEMLPRIEVVKADPDDDLLLATALAGGASFLVSGDRRHLVPLGMFAGIRVMDATGFLEQLHGPK